MAMPTAQELLDLQELGRQRIREFDTGATRDTNENKLEYRRFFSPMVLRRRAEFMHKNRVQRDGSLRDPDNWKKGIPRQVYLDSLSRHVRELEQETEDVPTPFLTEEDADTLCAILFNAEGLLYEYLMKRGG